MISPHEYDPRFVPPLELEGLEKKKQVLLHLVDFETGLDPCLKLLDVYLQSFTAEDPVTLLLYFSGSELDLENFVAEYERLSGDCPHIPDVTVLTTEELNQAAWPQVFARASTYLALGDSATQKGHLLRALLMGLKVYAQENNWFDPSRSFPSSLHLAKELTIARLRQLVEQKNGAQEAEAARAFVLQQAERFDEIRNIPANREVAAKDPLLQLLGFQHQTSRIALVLTMPRSGTWYHRYFFAFYQHLLKGAKPEDLVSKVLQGEIQASSPMAGTAFGPALFMVNHSICPGFLQICEPEFLQTWNQLQFYVDGFVEGLRFTESPLLNPVNNPEVRIVYVYRNPLDQAVSFFNHIRKHKDAINRFYTDEQGQKVEITSVKLYLFQVGLESYLKQYMTFKYMAEKYPGQIVMKSYESLQQSPSQHFLSMLEFMGHFPHEEGHVDVFERALQLSDKDTMKRMENRLGHALGNDQLDSKERHIRSGEIGQWHRHLNEADLQQVEAYLRPYGVSLQEFTIEAPEAAEP